MFFVSLEFKSSVFLTLSLFCNFELQIDFCSLHTYVLSLCGGFMYRLVIYNSSLVSVLLLFQ